MGLFACSHNAAVKETAIFTNVSIVVPPKTGWVPYRDYIGSNLEVMDVTTGARTVCTRRRSRSRRRTGRPTARRSSSTAAASCGRRSRDPGVAELNTGRVTRNNNDHVLSPDGTMLGISSNIARIRRRRPLGDLRVPATGGEPTASPPIRRPTCTAGRSTSSGCSLPGNATTSSTSTRSP